MTCDRGKKSKSIAKGKELKKNEKLLQQIEAVHSWIRGYAADMNEFLTERFTCDLLRCRKAAFRALSKTQFSLLAPNKDGLISLENIRSRLFQGNAASCFAAINVHQHESLDCLEESIPHAYELFEKNGNRAIVIKELASELGIGPAITVHSVLHDWIRHTHRWET
ncbi:CDPK-related kinase 8 [Raphanus sativus]|nr:CDPK-related kinase 8 [Raphanus sativus]